MATERSITPSTAQDHGDEAYTIAMDYREKSAEYATIARRKEIEAITWWAKAEMLKVLASRNDPPSGKSNNQSA